MNNTRPHLTSTRARCTEHPVHEPDYCPLCGTAPKIGE